jgi:hypothetical protein
MRPHPPAMAYFLLERFGVDESLIGDLAEDGRHHSSAWFWRQTIVALAKTATGDVRAHKVLALRALALGWAMQTLMDRGISARFRQVRLSRTPRTTAVTSCSRYARAVYAAKRIRRGGGAPRT